MLMFWVVYMTEDGFPVYPISLLQYYTLHVFQVFAVVGIFLKRKWGATATFIVYLLRLFVLLRWGIVYNLFFVIFILICTIIYYIMLRNYNKLGISTTIYPHDLVNKYCTRCKKEVIPQKQFHAFLFFIILFLTFITFLWLIYLNSYRKQEPRCPICKSSKYIIPLKDSPQELSQQATVQQPMPLQESHNIAQTIEIIFCPNCGNHITSNVKQFCTYCGEKLENRF